MKKNLRANFPILKDIIYFDNSALVLKPLSAINALRDFYLKYSISSRTSDTPIGVLVNSQIQSVREKVASLLDAKVSEIIFTSGTTESINYFVDMYGHNFSKKDLIIVSGYNHAANLLPWINLSKKNKFKLIITENITREILKHQDKISLISLSVENNNFQSKEDYEFIVNYCKKYNVILVNDAAQSISHQKTSLNEYDVIAFSFNKFYGPTGMGVLALKEKLIKKLSLSKFGGGSLAEVKKNKDFNFKNNLTLFEPGTPNIANFFMADKSLDFFNEIGYEQTQEILNDLSLYLHEKLTEVKNLVIYSSPGDNIALINFKNIPAQDVSDYLGSKNIYTIAGIFCSQYLRNIQSQYSFVRISLGIYNNKKDIDKLISELKNVEGNYGIW
ncbi:aminotransferase class V-fold PLP-dependent enzyme [Mycoplasmopsis synoviae]|uniref:aminotransferase class V-fold PLP-dependent enzyme n=1 Tax=Mycoplasmopsis synoviae TaxID=2109 RepID=UPI000CA2D482|nr:aminotransferase class V-fold PLP-dependent enzyme [Mycoplasmopsis synoviae]AKJ20518.1 Cysteine desulfurase, SufS subfamily [Mycoplasmopsis synoviae]AQU47831.1 Cysteine desulfurase, SufS subfamily [Mycoplasmopsis synoviae]AWL84088.1 aminotransferase class V [Mycoplasmopsis synoviae]QLE13809.1 aminotransferase class V [Mycoplasmopsis synoviae]UZF64585.1 aminotransferase class V-fold PLP-dependent enzyme [Mycoplasmopsis synoviae]